MLSNPFLAMYHLRQSCFRLAHIRLFHSRRTQLKRFDLKLFHLKLKPCVIFLSLVLLAGCAKYDIPAIEKSEQFPGGDTSVSITPFPSLMLEANNIQKDDIPDFHAGKALAHQPWVKAPTITFKRDGLGPIFNARTCLGCHINGGRGELPINQSDLNKAVVRISLPTPQNPNNSEKKQLIHHGIIFEPTYGGQIQNKSIALSHQLRHHLKRTNTKLDNNEAPAEAYVRVEWETHDFTYPDGTKITLKKPKANLYQLGYGDMHPKTLITLRNAPFMHGLGLLELIDQADIDKLSDPTDENKDGISGRINQVWHPVKQQTVPGRFGLKANMPNDLSVVTAKAFAEDIGISNPVLPKQPCTQNQPLCINTPNGNEPNAQEIDAKQLKLVTDFTRNIGVPISRQVDNNRISTSVEQGRELFYQSGCQNCHQPSFITQKSTAYPHLSQQTIWPYTDLLLHDMGEALSDNRSDFLATGSEWRTPPLWSLGLSEAVNGSKQLLHDGRAGGVEEAILWHGGEAEKSKQHFIQLKRAERKKVIQFIESL